jgi:hypothetical protein
MTERRLFQGRPRPSDLVLGSAERVSCSLMSKTEAPVGYAQARRIEVEVHYDERQIRLRVRDDGKALTVRR